MKTIFKEGDRVFCYNQGGWGNVIKIFSDDNPYPIYCSFDLGNSNFTKDGRFYADGPPILSFTEYTLEGFSQDRPEPSPKPGDIVWGKNFDEDNWHIGHFYLFDKSSVSLKYCISSNPAGNKNLWVQEITTKNPHANEQ